MDKKIRVVVTAKHIINGILDWNQVKGCPLGLAFGDMMKPSFHNRYRGAIRQYWNLMWVATLDEGWYIRLPRRVGTYQRNLGKGIAKPIEFTIKVPKEMAVHVRKRYVVK